MSYFARFIYRLANSELWLVALLGLVFIYAALAAWGM